MNEQAEFAEDLNPLELPSEDGESVGDESSSSLDEIDLGKEEEKLAELEDFVFGSKKSPNVEGEQFNGASGAKNQGRDPLDESDDDEILIERAGDDSSDEEKDDDEDAWHDSESDGEDATVLKKKHVPQRRINPFTGEPMKDSRFYTSKQARDPTRWGNDANNSETSMSNQVPAALLGGNRLKARGNEYVLKETPISMRDSINIVDTTLKNVMKSTSNCANLIRDIKASSYHIVVLGRTDGKASSVLVVYMLVDVKKHKKAHSTVICVPVSRGIIYSDCRKIDVLGEWEEKREQSRGNVASVATDRITRLCILEPGEFIHIALVRSQTIVSTTLSLTDSPLTKSRTDTTITIMRINGCIPLCPLSSGPQRRSKKGQKPISNILASIDKQRHPIPDHSCGVAISGSVLAGYEGSNLSTKGGRNVTTGVLGHQGAYDGLGGGLILYCLGNEGGKTAMRKIREDVIIKHNWDEGVSKRISCLLCTSNNTCVGELVNMNNGVGTASEGTTFDYFTDIKVLPIPHDAHDQIKRMRTGPSLSSLTGLCNTPVAVVLLVGIKKALLVGVYLSQDMEKAASGLELRSDLVKYIENSVKATERQQGEDYDTAARTPNRSLTMAKLCVIDPEDEYISACDMVLSSSPGVGGALSVDVCFGIVNGNISLFNASLEHPGDNPTVKPRRVTSTTKGLDSTILAMKFLPHIEGRSQTLIVFGKKIRLLKISETATDFKVIERFQYEHVKYAIHERMVVFDCDYVYGDGSTKRKVVVKDRLEKTQNSLVLLNGNKQFKVIGVY